MQIVSNFDLSAKKNLDSRKDWDSLNELKANSTILMPKGFLAYCKSEDKWYKMSCTDEGDPSTYTWTEFKTGSDYTLPTASTTTLGGVKVDGSTITVTNGVIKSKQATIDSTLNSTSTNAIQNKAVNAALLNKQDKLTAGDNVTIANNKISVDLSGLGDANAPLVASTASEMADTSKYYVYSGNEEGYENGYVYYYKDSAWVKGWSYQGSSETTASKVKMADNTTVEDTVSSLKEDLVNANDNITSNRKNTTFDVTTTWTSGKAIVATNDNLGTEGTSSILKLSDYIDLTNADKLTFKVPIFKNDTSYGYVFYDENKNVIKGVQFKNGGSYSFKEITIDVSNYSYIRTCWFTDTTTYGEFSAIIKKTTTGGLKSYVKGQDVIVASKDSNDFDKKRADYVCTGTNDEEIIQQAMDSIGQTGTCWLCSGNYYIDSFKEADDGGQPYAIRFRINGQSSNKLKGYSYPSRKNGTNNQFTNCAILNVTQSCYDSLDNDTTYTLIRAECKNGARSYPNVKVNVSEIAFKLPDNKKNIIGIDGYYATSMNIENIFGNALYSDANMDKADTLHIGAENCIGIRGMQGSNFGAGNLWKSCFMWGFGTAYDCSGEHLIIEDCGSRVCNKGWVFRSSQYGAGFLVHPMTVINCCSELDFNYPYFANNTNRQTINIIGFNVEHYPNHFELGGNYATEEVQGQWRGTINYTIQDFGNITGDGNLKNTRSGRFWAEGNGHGIVSKNDAQSQGGTSSERLIYGANYMQKYYDTDLNKLLIYNGDEWIDTIGNLISTSVKSIAFTDKELTIAVGETAETSFTILPSNATNKNVIYQNTDPDISSINVNTGVITAKAVGTNKITIISKDSGYTDTVIVTVINK